MSVLKEYIDKNLSENYTAEKTMSDTAVNSVTLYRQNNSENRLLLIRSVYRNDDVFRLLKGIKSENLPKIYEVASEDDALYILEEYISGTPLDQAAESGEISSEKVLKYAIDICRALSVLHRLNIIHRDIKPSNIIVTDDDRAVLIDLSIAKLFTGKKGKDTMNLGTIGYAAPEQFGFSESSPATDIYALGVLMNELLTGVHPTVEIPKGSLGKIIKKCTATQISKRYQNVSELQKALERKKTAR